jgi:hypothetical protein
MKIQDSSMSMASGFISTVIRWHHWNSAAMIRAGVEATKSLKNAMAGDV